MSSPQNDDADAGSDGVTGGEATKVRLQKVLAGAGVGSRRACDELIAAGRVKVNGVKAKPGVRVDPERDQIHVDGGRIAVSRELTYFALNKPVGLVTTMHDPEGRPCVGDLIAELSANVTHVGRLDADTEGLLLLTNDGELAHRLTHPSFNVTKRYLADVRGTVGPPTLKSLKRGIELDDGPARVDDVALLQSAGGHTLLDLTIHEGRNRIVRRLLEASGHPVERLVRTAIGPLRLGELRSGRWRALQRQEVESLMKSVNL